MTAQQESAIRRCEQAQRTGLTAKRTRFAQTDAMIQIAIETKYRTDVKA